MSLARKALNDINLAAAPLQCSGNQCTCILPTWRSFVEGQGHKLAQIIVSETGSLSSTRWTGGEFCRFRMSQLCHGLVISSIIVQFKIQRFCCWSRLRAFHTTIHTLSNGSLASWAINRTTASIHNDQTFSQKTVLALIHVIMPSLSDSI